MSSKTQSWSNKGSILKRSLAVNSPRGWIQLDLKVPELMIATSVSIDLAIKSATRFPAKWHDLSYSALYGQKVKQPHVQNIFALTKDDPCRSCYKTIHTCEHPKSEMLLIGNVLHKRSCPRRKSKHVCNAFMNGSVRIWFEEVDTFQKNWKRSKVRSLYEKFYLINNQFFSFITSNEQLKNSNKELHHLLIFNLLLSEKVIKMAI